MNVIGLIRVSTEDQGRSGLGLEAQAHSIREYCEARGHTLSAIFREVVSGSADFSQRLGLAAALEAAKDSGSVLCVAKRDRLSRDPMVAMLIEREVTVLSADGTADGADPGAVFTRRVLDAVAELERNMIAARTKAALAAKKARGEPMGRPPFGFRYVSGNLEEHPSEFRILCRIVELHQSGKGVRAIAKRLNELGHAPQKGGRWFPTQVHRVLKKAEAVLA